MAKHVDLQMDCWRTRVRFPPAPPTQRPRTSTEGL